MGVDARRPAKKRRHADRRLVNAIQAEGKIWQLDFLWLAAVGESAKEVVPPTNARANQQLWLVLPNGISENFLR